MSVNDRRTDLPLGIGLVLLVVPTGIALATGLWVLTAIPVGVLFGFFLQKGDLCGASAISEVILFRDRRKLLGLWLAIVVSMVGFAAFDLLGWVKLNPKPLVWANFAIGGVIFGTGTVLAGGCVSGCLYKSGTGNLNSMAALVGIPIGVAVVEYGPLAPLNTSLKELVVKADGGGSVTFGSLTGIPFWVLALAFAAATVGGVNWWRRRAGGPTLPKDVVRGESPGWLRRSWKPWHAGIAIGILGALAYLSSAASGRNYPLGVTHGVLHAELLAFDRDVKHVWKKPAAVKKAPAPAVSDTAPGRGTPPPPPRRKVVWWLVALVASMVGGSWLSARLSGQVKLLPRPPGETIVAFLGGLLVGCGAGLAKGCVIGNILSGIGLMSVGTVLFAVCTVLANWAATYVYLMGGLSGRRNSSDGS